MSETRALLGPRASRPRGWRSTRACAGWKPATPRDRRSRGARATRMTIVCNHVPACLVPADGQSSGARGPSSRAGPGLSNLSHRRTDLRTALVRIVHPPKSRPGRGLRLRWSEPETIGRSHTDRDFRARSVWLNQARRDPHCRKRPASTRLVLGVVRASRAEPHGPRNTGAGRLGGGLPGTRGGRMRAARPRGRYRPCPAHGKQKSPATFACLGEIGIGGASRLHPSHTRSGRAVAPALPPAG